MCLCHLSMPCSVPSVFSKTTTLGSLFLWLPVGFGQWEALVRDFGLMYLFPTLSHHPVWAALLLLYCTLAEVTVLWCPGSCEFSTTLALTDSSHISSPHPLGLVLVPGCLTIRCLFLNFGHIFVNGPFIKHLFCSLPLVKYFWVCICCLLGPRLMQLVSHLWVL